MKKMFNPLLFLSALGAWGIAIIPFAFMNYSVPHAKGLITFQHIQPLLSTSMAWLYYMFFIIMISFWLLHLVLMVIFFIKFFAWNKTSEAKEYKEDPLRNPGITTPILAFAMTMNLFIGVIRFFVPSISQNLQAFMLPALIIWLLLWVITMYVSLNITKKAFIKNFVFENISFGWLLVPFTIGMVTVVWAGIAALSKDSVIANIAAFFTFVSFGFGLFLFITKLVTLFQKHFADKNGLPSKQSLPGFLIVVPNVTLYSIILFRLWHYFANQTWSHADLFLFFVIIWWFAFETWYLLFGLSLLRSYFKEQFFKKEFYVTMWWLICPIVAYAVLGSFVYQQFFQSPIIYWLVVVMMIVSVVLYAIIAKKNLWCRSGVISCE